MARAGAAHGANVEQALMESELARQLLAATDDQRQLLYGEAYDQIYQASLAGRGEQPLEQTFGAQPYMIDHLLKLVRPGQRVLEVGCGCGYLSLEMARRGLRVTGVDVSAVAVETARRHAAALDVPPGFRPEFEVVTGTSLPFEDNQFALVFSVEVVEHLHERDVPAHLREVFRVLRPGGHYWLLTPNRHQGVDFADRFGLDHHDHADGEDVHLKEWTYAELSPVMQRVGFRQLRSPWRVRRGKHLPTLPAAVKVATEHCANRTSSRWAKMSLLHLGGSLHLTLIGTKPRRRQQNRARTEQPREDRYSKVSNRA